MTALDTSRAAPFDPAAWRIEAEAHRFERHLGRPSLYLSGGLATLGDVRLEHGVIAFDVALPRTRAFVGGIWRVQDDENYEWFFLRPHQSGNPDATQYTPVFNGLPGWQLYHGPRYTVAVDYPFDAWLPVRIAFAGARAEISVGGRPALVVEGLKREPAPGGIGLGVGSPAGAHVSAFSWAPLTPPPHAPAAPGPRRPGTIPVWEVSDAFAEAALAGDALPDEVSSRRTWTRLASEPSGLADLARVNGLAGGRDTVLVRAVVHADRPGAKRLELGFSDRVRVYLNGRLLFQGDDSYRSRDYRFLGSIGWFDTLWLALEAGPNELVLAVTEELGGWGVQARFPDPDGLKLAS